MAAASTTRTPPRIACRAWATPWANTSRPASPYEGHSISLPTFTGKAVVVTIWATWCQYCLKELPILDAIQAKAGKSQMEVIAVNTEEWVVFRKATKALRGVVRLDLTNDYDGQARKAYGGRGIPHMVIIGRDGRIVGIHRGYGEKDLDDIVADINLALAPPAPAPSAPPALSASSP